MSSSYKSKSLVVLADHDGQVRREFRDLELNELAQDFVRVEIKYSSMNYKDALCATGHPGVARKLPIVPGIDAAGTVVQSNADRYPVGSEVMIFHADFGTKVNGGYTQFVDVHAEFAYILPNGLSHRESMILGTAGFTAAQSVDELIKHSVDRDAGPVVVSGATGGVGSLAVKLLAKLGYEVVASTGKSEHHEMLKQLGANQVVDRTALNDTTETPLLKGQWAGAVDTVGGNTLATILRSTRPHGCVTACGLVGGVNLPITVYPFILRGVTLKGIDTASIDAEYRASIWDRLATAWKLDGLDALVTEIGLDGLDGQISAILKGSVSGRVVVNLSGS